MGAWRFLTANMRKIKIKISKESIEKAVRNSCMLEGIDYSRAMENTEAIKLLKKHGHVFSIDLDDYAK